MTDPAALRVALSRAIPRALLADVEDKLPYAAEEIASHRIDPGRADEIHLTLRPGADEDAVTAKVRRLVEGMIAGWREVPAKTREDWRDRPIPAPCEPWDALVEAGLVTPLGPGQVALSGLALHLYEWFDRRFAALGAAMGAQPARYPQMIPVATLDRCAYFSSFPHHVTFCSHLAPDVEVLEAFARPRRPGEGPHLNQGLVTPAHALNPAMCFHAYAVHADRPLAAPLTLTTVGRCFRYEAGALTTLERLWDFTMREIIFVADAATVRAQREATIAAVGALVAELGLNAWVETANDPFFMTNFVAKKYHQLLTDAKFELRLTLPASGRSVAAASFNYHESFFGRSYGISWQGAPAHTACTAFGVERWVYAFLAQHGLDPRAWPEGPRPGV